MQIRAITTAALLIYSFLAPFARAQSKRPIATDDIYRTQQVANPQCSPDGKWIAYIVTVIDRDADKQRTSIWMVNWEGTRNLQLTTGPEDAGSPRRSPDGNYLAFLSVRPAGAKKQIWLLDRLGGEARQLTDVKGEIGTYAWSPDGNKIVLEISDSDTDASASKNDSSFAQNRKAHRDQPLSLQTRRRWLYLTAAARVWPTP